MADPIQINSSVELPAPPLWEKHNSRTSSDTTPSFSPEQIAEHERSAALSAKEQAALDPRAKLETEQAQINADKAAKDLAIQDELDKKKAAADELHTARIAQQAEVLRQANEAIKARPAPALFADRQGWDKAKLAIGLAFAGLGDAMKARAAARLGSANVGNMDAVGDIINADLDRQREAIKKLSDNQVIAKEGVKDAMQARELALSRIDITGAEMFKRANLHTQQLLAAKGVALPEIAKNEKVLELQRKEQERRDAAVAPLVQQHAEHVEKSRTDRAAPAPKTGGAPPEHVSQSSDFADRMALAEKEVRGLPPISEEGLKIIRQDAANEAALDKYPGGKAAAIAAGEYKNIEEKLSDSDRRAYQAQQRFIGAKLRRESGAAIAASEYLKEAPQLFGTLGDKDADRLAKAKAREQVIRGTARGGRPGDEERVMAQLNGRPAPTPSHTPPAPVLPPGNVAPMIPPAGPSIPPMLARPPEAATPPPAAPAAPTFAQAQQAAKILLDPNAPPAVKARAQEVSRRWRESRGQR